MTTYKVAIVGAGPAGYFTAQALQNNQNDERKFEIDMIERLPTPWGLVRSGVAPDHPKIKTVAKVFEKVAAEPGFRLFGNVEIPTDVTIDALRYTYDVVVVCTGSALGKTLGIPGENLKGVISAADFVPWYNGHPDFADLDIPLDTETAVVIGAGNVAMDCARMLAVDPAELDSTDTAEHALIALHKSQIRNVHLVARRGPEHAAFTAPELRELPKLEHTDVFVNADEVAAGIVRAEIAGDVEKDLRSNLDAMKLIAETAPKGVTRKMRLEFLLAPKEIIGTDKVEGITFSVNRVENGKVIDTGETLTTKCGLVIPAIGYHAAAIEGVPYENGKIKNVDGRVADGLYTVGWAKRGPSGVIGTNKSDASAVVELIISDLTAPKSNGDIINLLPENHRTISQQKWMKINEAEIAAGEPVGKPRIKEVSREKLLGLGDA
jgi:ferredoxin--NADP+ reductase